MAILVRSYLKIKCLFKYFDARRLCTLTKPLFVQDRLIVQSYARIVRIKIGKHLTTKPNEELKCIADARSKLITGLNQNSEKG